MEINAVMDELIIIKKRDQIYHHKSGRLLNWFFVNAKFCDTDE